MSKTNMWQSVSQRKRDQQLARIPKEWRISKPASFCRPIDAVKECAILSTEELEWTDPRNDATTTLQRLASGEVTCEKLITAFCKRAAVAHQLTNCLTEIMFTEAIERAKHLDHAFRTNGKVVGPCHGLPISVKDHLDVEGFDTSTGIASLCFDPATTTSQLVQMFIDNGAVVIAKTNVPQTCLTADTINTVFGRTTNAYKSTFGASGSSGGEASLVAMGGSLLGIGSDGAGSIRMPAAANGVVGYKPSGYRLPMDGRAIFGHGLCGTTAFGPVSLFGFLARSIRDARFSAKLVSDSRPWESNPFLYPSPWQEIQAPRPRIGVWSANTFLNLHPPIERGFLWAQKRLREANYELVEFSGPDISEVWDLCKDWTEIQGLWKLREYLSDEPLTTSVKDTGIIFPKSPRPPLTIEYLHDMNLRLAKLAFSMAKAWTSSGQSIDALLWVVAPHTALPFDKWTDTTFTCLFNAIDWPAISLPLSLFSDKSVDIEKEINPLSALDTQIQGLYDAEAFYGLPLNVQLIGRRFEDEKLLSIAEQLHPIICSRR